jgi:site-specific DNA-methyltransferase (adenine-specific)
VILCDGAVDLRVGDWRKVLANVDAVDSCIADAPYSERTHKGALSTTGEAGVTGYSAWTPDDAIAFLDSWHPRVRSWIVIHTDDVLAPLMRRHLEELGRYTFPIVPVLQHAPRVTGDGPGSPGHFLVVARPREKRFLSWGSLPCWYEVPRDGSFVRGGKPLGLMRAIVRDYTRPGDLVVDPFAGGGTTALACAMEGRRCVTSEVDPKTHEIARARLATGFTADMFSGASK